jgi:hypothetical protein
VSPISIAKPTVSPALKVIITIETVECGKRLGCGLTVAPALQIKLSKPRADAVPQLQRGKVLRDADVKKTAGDGL